MLVVHGIDDEIVPFDLGRDTAALLEMHDVPVTFRSYAIGHETTPTSLADAHEWLARVHAGDVPRAPVADSP